MDSELKKNEKKYQEAQECPIAIFVKQVGGKWKPIIIWLLAEKTKIRFNELNRAIAGVSQKVLTQQLKELEEINLITRKSYPEIPPRVEYSLTEKGSKLKELLGTIKQWTQENLMLSK